MSKSRLPIRTTLVLYLVLIITVWNAVRLWTGISWHTVFNAYAPRPGPFYVGVTGAVFATVGLIVLWAFWQRYRWAPHVLLVAAVAYTGWTWTDKLFLQSQLQPNWPFLVVITIVLLGFTVTSALDTRNL